MALFSVDFAPQYLTFFVSYTKFPVKLSIDKCATHNNEQFGGYFRKVKQILSILHGF